MAGCLIAAGPFREHLYYRLCAFPIRIPPRGKQILGVVESTTRRVRGVGGVAEQLELLPTTLETRLVRNASGVRVRWEEERG